MGSCAGTEYQYDVKSFVFGNKNKEYYPVYPNENGVEIIKWLVMTDISPGKQTDNVNHNVSHYFSHVQFGFISAIPL